MGRSYCTVSVGYQLASGAGIVLLGYGFPGGRCFLRLLAWFAALHFALTGAVLLPAAQGIMNRTYDAMFPLLGVAAIYLVLVMLLTWLLGKFERRLAQSDR